MTYIWLRRRLLSSKLSSGVMVPLLPMLTPKCIRGNLLRILRSERICLVPLTCVPSILSKGRLWTCLM